MREQLLMHIWPKPTQNLQTHYTESQNLKKSQNVLFFLDSFCWFKLCLSYSLAWGRGFFKTYVVISQNPKFATISHCMPQSSAHKTHVVAAPQRDFISNPQRLPTRVSCAHALWVTCVSATSVPKLCHLLKFYSIITQKGVKTIRRQCLSMCKKFVNTHYKE